MLVRALLSERVTLYILKKNCVLVRALLFGGLTHVEKKLRADACSSFWESHSLHSQKELRAGACSSFWGTDS